MSIDKVEKHTAAMYLEQVQMLNSVVFDTNARMRKLEADYRKLESVLANFFRGMGNEEAK